MLQDKLIEFKTKNFKNDCLNTLVKEENYPLLIVWHSQGKGLGISISEKIAEAKMLATFLFSRIRFKQ
jgi:hypothetical protein